MGEQSRSISAGLSRPIEKIVCVHLLNDFSGSPLVFSNVINGLRDHGIECDLHTCGGREGFLSDLDVNYHFFNYRFFPNRNNEKRQFELCCQNEFILYIRHTNDKCNE